MVLGIKRQTFCIPSCQLLVLLLLILSIVQCNSHTTSALLTKASRSVVKASKRAGSAVSKAGSKALKQAGSTAVAGGIKAGQVLADAGRNFQGAKAVQRAAAAARNRGWEGAKAARNRDQAVHQTGLAEHQQEEAQILVDAVFPQQSCSRAAEDADRQCQMGQETRSSHQQAAKGEVAGSYDTAPAASTPALGHSSSPAATEPPQATPAAPKGAEAHSWTGGWVVVYLMTHLVAFSFGWMLRGRQTHRQQQQQQGVPLVSTHKQTDLQQERPAQSPRPLQQQQQHPAAAASCNAASNSSSAAQPGAVPVQKQHGSSGPVQPQRARPASSAAAPAGEQQQGGVNSSSNRGHGSSVAPPPPAGPMSPTSSETGSSGNEYVVVDKAADEASTSMANQNAPEQVGTAAVAASVAEAAMVAAATMMAAAGPTALPQSTADSSSHQHAAEAVQGQIEEIDESTGTALVVAGGGGGVTGGLTVANMAGILQLHQQQRAGPVFVVDTLVVHHNNVSLRELVQPVTRAVDKLGNAVQRVEDVLSHLVGMRTADKAQEQLADQQALFERAGHLGQLVGLAVMTMVALRAGRVWEVHQVCLGAVAPSPGWGHWMGQLSGMQGAMNGLRYINCCARQLGMYAGGLFVVYLLARFALSGVSAHMRAASGRPSNAYQLDLIVFKGLVCSTLGSILVHCLGGAWLPWLVGWLLSCSFQLVPNVRIVSRLQSAVFVVLVVLVPAATSWATFLPKAFTLQASLLEAVPLLRSVHALLPGRL